MKPLFLLAAALFPAVLLHGALSIRVDAGDFERRETLVELDWNSGVTASALVDDKGQSTALQVQGSRAAFIVRDLKKGESRTYKPANPGVRELARADATPAAITLSAFGRKAFVYHIAKTELPSGRSDLTPVFRRGGYIHPVLSPEGLQVTDDYPRNHKHHHGIWFSWAKAVFDGRINDFWNMGDARGTMDVLGVDKSWNGPVHAGFVSRHQHVDLTSGKPKPALNESWTVRLFAVGQGPNPYFLFDLEITNSCVTPKPVILPEYRYGGMCVRGNWAWNGTENTFILTSEGETDRRKGDKSQVRARWVHMGGKVDGKLTGIAALGHPKNIEAPEPVRLNPAEPYFNFTPQQAGDFEITPDQPFVAKYRFVVADGAPDRSDLDRLWNDYAHPPKVTISE